MFRLLLPWILVSCAAGDGASDGHEPPPDGDGDGLTDATDLCPTVADPDQADADGDGTGDLCEPDGDTDGAIDDSDNCLLVANADQADVDSDTVGDVCDNCPDDANLDQVDTDGDAFGDACPCDACEAGTWCVEHPEHTTCEDGCPPELQATDGKCCPLGTRFYPDEGLCLLPDLFIEENQLLSSMNVEQDDFEADDCEIVEGCVPVPGRRRLLRFDTMTPNTGDGDLFMGPPQYRPDLFTFSPCHNHYHFNGYASYELVDSLGNVVAPGHKQAFCLLDFVPWDPQLDFGDAKYTCEQQGISQGFADIYDSYLDCQYVDITDVAPGDYVLRVTLNVDHVVAELDYTNNVAEVPVTLEGAGKE
jgi:hypothetical protein